MSLRVYVPCQGSLKPESRKIDLGNGFELSVIWDSARSMVFHLITVNPFNFMQCSPPRPLLERASFLTLQLKLPVECWQHRDDGFYQLGSATAWVNEESTMVNMEAANLADLKAIWQALLDGTIRPERPLYIKEQQGPSYSELSAKVAEMTPQLRAAMIRLGELESVVIHLTAVARSSGDVLEVQRHEIARLRTARDAAELDLLDRKDRAGDIR